MRPSTSPAEQGFAQQLVDACRGPRGAQAPGAIPFKALAGDLIGWHIGAAMAWQRDFGELARLVPAVLAAVLDAGAAVAGFEQLACRIPAVGLQPLVEPFFLGEPVITSQAKRLWLLFSLIRRVRRPARSYSNCRRSPPWVRLMRRPPQVVGQLDGVRRLAFAQLDAADLPLGVVRIALGLAIGQARGRDAALAVAMVHGALAQRIDDLDQLAEAVVAVFGGALRAVGVAHHLVRSIAESQALGAALGVFDLVGAVADERCFLRAG